MKLISEELELEIKETAYRTSYLMMNGWVRYFVTWDLLEENRPDLYHNERNDVARKNVWRKELPDAIWNDPGGFESQLISVNFLKKDIYPVREQMTTYFTLDEAYHHQMNKSLI